MRREVQAFVLLLLGVITLRITWSDLFLNYVREPMRPLLLASGAFLAALGVWCLVKAIKKPEPAAAGASDHGHDHSKAPTVAWLLLLPVAAIFLVAPPPLGADAAERDSGTQALAQSEVSVYEPLPTGADPILLDLDDYAARALFDEGRTLTDRTISMQGFVTTNKAGQWYLTRFVSSCCAADASAVKVQVEGATAPPVEQWVEVTGRYLPSESADYEKPPLFDAEQVVNIEPPRDTYL